MRGFFFKYMSQALININIQRQSGNINGGLPVVLFNACDFLSGYAQSLKGLLNSGILPISALNDANTGSIKYRYQSGLQFDNLVASCNEIPLITLLQNTYTNKIKIKNLEYSLDDFTTANRQYLQKIYFIEGGVFGKKIADTITPNMYRNDTQKIQDSINIPLNLEVTANNGLVVFIADQLSINLSLTIEY